MNDPITSFSGEFRFLSNFWPVTLVFEGIEFKSSEHAYVAAKTIDMAERYEISQIETAGKVKRYGRELTLREDWEEVRIEKMRKIIELKFKPGTELNQMLLDTGNRTIIEGNTWGDVFWGQCPIGTGKNNLGILLMELRDDISRRFI